MRCVRCKKNSAVNLYAQAEDQDTLGPLCEECAEHLEDSYSATITYGRPQEPENEE